MPISDELRTRLDLRRVTIVEVLRTLADRISGITAEELVALRPCLERHTNALVAAMASLPATRPRRRRKKDPKHGRRRRR